MFKYKVGDYIIKSSGDYQTSGYIKACFLNHANEPRYVVEHAANIIGYFYHIYSENQLTNSPAPFLRR